MSLSRRSFIKGVAGAAGIAAGTRLAGSHWINEAKADLEKPGLLMIFLDGGYNALFGAADGLIGKFGVTAQNITDLGNGLKVDASTYGTLPALARSRMATIGVDHGVSDHEPSKIQKWWSDGTRSYPLMLASALGGDAPIKAAVVGEMPPGPRPPEGLISLQRIRDMEPTISALGGGVADARTPARGTAAAVLERSAAMSKRSVDSNSRSLASLKEAYPTTSAVLRKAVKPFSFASLSSAYGLGTSTSLDSFRAQMAAAELMFTAGSNVVLATDLDWDTHGDGTGTVARDRMTANILPGLKTFLSRMFADPTMNVVVAIAGDFSRSLPGSDHQPNCAVTVMGKYVKVGTTGRVNGNVDMPAGTPDVPQLWSFLAAALKAPQNPFGPNPHALVL